MCLYGNYREVKVNLTSKKDNIVLIDACIADEIQILNEQGIQTLGCCCSHGEAGWIVEHENTLGKWEEANIPAHTLIRKESVQDMKDMGYIVYPFYYTEGTDYDVFVALLKSGCTTKEECKEWHESQGLPYEKNLGVLQ